MLSSMALFWLVALIVFAVAEGITVGLVSIWFAGGSLVALVAAGLAAPLWVQGVLFLMVSAVLLSLLRPFMKKIIRPVQTRTNADRHIGRTALVTEEIDNLRETGAVRLDGVVWSARSETDQVIPVGDTIAVRRIAGVKLWVESVTPTSHS